MRISPSGLKRGKCLRRAIAEKKGKFPDSFGTAAAFGTDVHALLEAKALAPDTVEFDLNDRKGRLAAEMWPHGWKWMRDGWDWKPERDFLFTAGGLEYHGYIDLSGVTGQETFVSLDRKTSGDPWAWGISTEEAAEKDEQSLIYLMNGTVIAPSCQGYAFGWVYGSTKSLRYAYSTSAPFDGTAWSQAEVVDRFFEHIDPRAHVLHDAFEAYDLPEDTDLPTRLRVLNEIPADPTQCEGKTRNCGFRKHCTCPVERVKVSVFASEKTLEGIVPMAEKSLQEIAAEQKARRLAAQGQPPPAAPPAAPVDDRVKQSATPVETQHLPPEAAEALENALAQRNLPPEQQDVTSKKKATKPAAAAAASPDALAEATTIVKQGLEDGVHVVVTIEGTKIKTISVGPKLVLA